MTFGLILAGGYSPSWRRLQAAGLAPRRVAGTSISTTRRKAFLRLTVFWYLLVCSLPAFGTFARPRFDVWTTDTGLPQNSVTAILQTRDGYLWFSTYGGLVRYDGVRFTVFDKANSPGIKSNRLTALFEDRAGDLWIGTEDSGLIRYQNGTFTTYTTREGMPGNWVRAIEGDEGGCLWVLTGERIAQWRDGRFTVLFPEGALTLSPATVGRSTSRGGITFYDHAGLHRFTGGRLVTHTTKDGLPSLRINSDYQDQHGTLWLGTKDRGLNRFKDNAFSVYTVADGLPSNNVKVTAACEDSKGNLWIATSERGLSRMRGGTLTTYTAADGLPSSEIHAIYEDREGSIWIGTSSKGLYRFRDEVITTYSERDGLSANNIYPVYEDRAGHVWIGAWPGLNRYKGGVFTRSSTPRATLLAAAPFSTTSRRSMRPSPARLSPLRSTSPDQFTPPQPGTSAASAAT